MMKIFLFGTGHMAEELLNRIVDLPKNIEVLGFIDNDCRKWEKEFYGKLVYSPRIVQEVEVDKIIVLSDVYFETIKENLLYWYGIDENKIKDRNYLLKLLLIEKYKNTEDMQIQESVTYWERNEISVYNQYLNGGKEKHIVQWDCIENMPYIIFEDKRMYFPYDYKFEECEGKKVVVDITVEQQPSSPHLYIKDDIKIESGDIIADAGVQEGNFALRYIEKVSKAYLFECNRRWIRPLEKTFEKFKDKVILYDRFLGQFCGGMSINLDSAIKDKLDFLKMDIEGAEIQALLGGRDTLKKNNVKCAICSYHKCGDETAIKDILSAYGYRTSTSDGYMVFYYDKNIYSTLDFRKGIVYGRKI